MATLINHSPSQSALTYQEAQTGQLAQKPIKVLNSVWGAVLSFFGQALKVEQTNGQIKYVSISELKEKFVFSHLHGLSQAEAKRVRNDKILHHLFLSTINPLKGNRVSKKTLEAFSQKTFECGLNFSSKDSTTIHASIRKIRAAVHTQKGLTHDQKNFIGNIQLGDILFHRTDDSVDSQIVTIQKFAAFLGFGPKHRDGVQHNHVYMCAKVDDYGKKWFAEAAWPSGKYDEIRLISEDDLERCFIKQDHGAITEIFRSANPRLAKKAAKEARLITTKLEPQEKGSTEEQRTKLRYSKANGKTALISSISFSHQAKTRLFQWIEGTKDGKMSAEFKKSNGFFCSALVGYAYQMAEARPIVAKLMKEKPKSDAAHRLAQRHGKELDRQMQFKFDTKHSTPGDLYSWLNEHPKLFTSVQSYQQPNTA